MKLDDFADAQSAARNLKEPDAIARALIRAKMDGIAEAISQVSQANRDGRDQKLKSVQAALQSRREAFAKEIGE